MHPTGDPPTVAATEPTTHRKPTLPSVNFWKERNPLPLFSSSQKEYISLASALERSMFMIGFAVILSAILEAKSSQGLNPYHALIVLNVSQINNWSGFLILSSRGQLTNPSGHRQWGISFITRKSFLTPGFVLYTMHAMMMAGLGLYFWADLAPFLAYARSAVVQPCQPVTFFWVFGAVDVTNRTLRIASLVFYALSIVPIVNLFLVVIMASATLVGLGFPALIAALLLGLIIFLLAFILLPILAFFSSLFWHLISRIPLVQKLGQKSHVQLVTAPFKRLRSPTSWLGLGRLYGPTYGLLFSLAVGMFYSAPIVYFMVSTELIVKANKPNVQPGTENKWTYGQTLALFSALTAIGLYVYQLYFLLRRRARKHVAKVAEVTRAGVKEHANI
ncbi:hypothetical protein H0H87_011470 [Tephrocybe sp. NHM501043]|nr:hypothetical protein H0H87_011470 [Tephrocybe sp. NHM501043]